MSRGVTIIDYGMGNLLSVSRALEQVGGQVTLSSDPAEIARAQRLLLPGVGAFGDGMAELDKRGLSEPLRDAAAAGKPLLGICLGAQMLLNSSEEFGQHAGLGLIPGQVRAIPREDSDGMPLKVPHMGWADLVVERPHPLLDGVPEHSAVYFVHSFHAVMTDAAARVAHCDYGGHALTAMIATGNIAGCQFHPEKSGPVGLHILNNFLQLG